MNDHLHPVFAQALQSFLFPATASAAAVAQVNTEPPVDRAVYAEALDIVAELASNPSSGKVDYLVHRAAKLATVGCTVYCCQACADERADAADDLAGCYGKAPR